MAGSMLYLSSHTMPGAVILGQWVGNIQHCHLGLCCVAWGFLVVVSQRGRAIVAVEKLGEKDGVVKCNGSFGEST